MHYSDVQVLNFETMVWNTLVTTGPGPGPRDSHSTVLLGNNMIVFGGTSGSKKCNDLHILNLITKEWTRLECGGTPPSPRESHSATLVDDVELVVFGGSGEGECLNDLHVLDLRTMRWTSPEVKGDIPVPRDSHSAIAIGNKMFVYGGDRGDRYYGDVDMLDMDTMTWSRVWLSIYMFCLNFHFRKILLICSEQVKMKWLFWNSWLFMDLHPAAGLAMQL